MVETGKSRVEGIKSISKIKKQKIRSTDHVCLVVKGEEGGKYVKGGSLSVKM